MIGKENKPQARPIIYTVCICNKLDISSCGNISVSKKKRLKTDNRSVIPPSQHSTNLGKDDKERLTFLGQVDKRTLQLDVSHMFDC